jgi:lipoprotein-anchoring transpeptidase ErfK/SrfK
MSLPSQSSRNVSRSSQVYYRRSRKGPIGRLIGAIVVIALFYGIWYLFIRSDSPTPPLDDQPNELANNTTPANNISNEDRPTRPLPGSGQRRDTSDDVSRALGSNTNTPVKNDPVEISNRAPTTGTPTNTDILDAATREASNTPANTNTNTEPARQPQIEDRRTTALTGVQLQLDTARRLIRENDRVGARALLSRTLLNANLSASEAQLLRDELTVINSQLVFSPTADPRDPMTEEYKVASGDSLSRIAGRRELATHWKLISRINKISDPSKIRLGQSLKLVRGPFHAIVDKSDHRIDIFHGSPADPSSWLYIRSFDVGLGESDGTPVGEFVVSANKLENPGWVNPRNARERYEPNDPKNPIGEFWIGLTGQGEASAYTSYGIHGTIDPSSIGGDESMGCVRLANGDIDIVYELLAEHVSRVLIVP